VPALEFTQAETAEAIRSLYRDPVDATAAAGRECLEFQGLHYPPRAVAARANALRGALPTSGVDEPAAATALRAIGFAVALCEAAGGACCGGVAGVEPAEMSPLARPQDG
jgi:hypothetical protein